MADQDIPLDPEQPPRRGADPARPITSALGGTAGYGPRKTLEPAPTPAIADRHGAVGSARRHQFQNVVAEHVTRRPHGQLRPRLPTRSAAASPCATSPAMTAPPKPISSGCGDNSRDSQNRSRPSSNDKRYAAIDGVTGTSVIEGFDDGGSPGALQPTPRPRPIW